MIRIVPARMLGQLSGRVTRMKVRQARGAEVAGPLEQAAVDPVEAGVHGEDEVRDVAVGEGGDHRVGVAVEPFRRGADADVGEHLVDVAVGREQPDPGQHPHQVADPERDEDQEQQQALAAFRRGGRCSRRPGTRSRSRGRSSRRRRRRCCGSPASRCRRGRRSENASLTKPTFHSSGFQIGTGCRRVSILPIATASTA